mmetsp:Transcript_24304/g.43529  ORF Transcript_24304/g.43529 Transcript_24304/m.43529 type:complete len:229 (-) Transcript_24304:318-1004(-)
MASTKGAKSQTFSSLSAPALTQNNLPAAVAAVSTAAAAATPFFDAAAAILANTVAKQTDVTAPAWPSPFVAAKHLPEAGPSKIRTNRSFPPEAIKLVVREDPGTAAAASKHSTASVCPWRLAAQPMFESWRTRMTSPLLDTATCVGSPGGPSKRRSVTSSWFPISCLVQIKFWFWFWFVDDEEGETKSMRASPVKATSVKDGAAEVSLPWLGCLIMLPLLLLLLLLPP